MTTRMKALCLAALLIAALATAALAEGLPTVQWADWSAIADAMGFTLRIGDSVDANAPDAAAPAAAEDAATAAPEPAEVLPAATDGDTASDSGAENAAADEPIDAAAPEASAAAPEGTPAATGGPAAVDGTGSAADDGAATDGDEAAKDASASAEAAPQAAKGERQGDETAAPEGADAAGTAGDGSDADPISNGKTDETGEGSEMEFIAIDGDESAPVTLPVASPEATPAPDQEAGAAPEAGDEASAVTGSEGEADADRWLITTASVNLRREPTTKGESITIISEGTPLYSLERSVVDSDNHTWCHVRYGEVDCWVSGSYVRERTQEDIDEVLRLQKNATGTKVVANDGAQVKLRGGPSLTSAVLGVLRGEAAYLGKAQLDDRPVLWYYVECNGIKGWVSSKLVTLQ